MFEDRQQGEGGDGGGFTERRERGQTFAVMNERGRKRDLVPLPRCTLLLLIIKKTIIDLFIFTFY